MPDDDYIEYEYDQSPPPEEEGEPPVLVPPDALSPAAVSGVIDAFVLREGTDYGERETAHETKVAQVRRQLERGEIVIVFDPKARSVTLLPRAEWKKLAGASER